MELAQPDRLLLLALLPLLYLLSLPPRPKATVMTAHLAQWLEARRKLKRRPVRFRWLRFLLLAAAFAAVVVAHAEPRLRDVDGATELVLLVDTSASMAAPGENLSAAYDEAERVLLDWLESVPAHIDVRLGLCGQGIEVVRGTRVELIDAVRRHSPTGLGTVNLAAAAAALTGPRIAVATVTDGLGPSRAPTVGALRIVGRPRANGGITSCVVRDSWPLPEVALDLECVWHGDEPQRFEVITDPGDAVGAPVRSAPFVLNPGIVQGVSLAMRRGEGGALTVRLRPAPENAEATALDEWSADDRVSILLPPPPRPKIAVRAEGAPTRALTLVARALAEEAGGEVVGADVSSADFLILEGGSLPSAPEKGTRMISFGTHFGDAARTSVASPRVVDWDREAAITAGLDLSELQVVEALAWKAPHGGVRSAAQIPGHRDGVLVSGSEGPLAVWRPADGAETSSKTTSRGGADAVAPLGPGSVHFAFRLADSNLFKLAAFPQTVRRCFAAAYGGAGRPEIQPGAVMAAAESRLQWLGSAGQSTAPRPAARPLPGFASPGRGFAVPLLLLGLILLAIRVYV